MKVVLILPSYNELGNLKKIIPMLQNDIFPRIKNHKMYILIADDNSPDGTEEAIREMMKKWKNIDITLGKKLGLGAALVRGMNYAVNKMDAEILMVMDADGQHEAGKIPEFLKKIDEGYDMVIGTRYSGGGSIPKNWPIQRKAFSIFGNLLIRSILGKFYIHDWTGGFRAFKKEVFLKERSELTEFKGYTFQVSFNHKALRDKFSFAEVPFSFTDRTLGDSKIAPLEYITNVLKYVIVSRFWEMVHSPFLKYGITGFFGYLINAITLYVLQRKAGFHPSTAGMVGAEISIIWNFIINNYWGFRHHQIGHGWKMISKFLQFNLVSAGSVVIIGLVQAIGHLLLGDTLYGVDTSQILLIIAIGLFVVPYSYTMYNIFIWKRWRFSFLSKIQDFVG